MIVDPLKKKQELLEEHYNIIKKKINNCYGNKSGFTVAELLGTKNDAYYRYMTKGIILTLLSLDYIEIFGTYNGNKNYIYFTKKLIP